MRQERRVREMTKKEKRRKSRVLSQLPGEQDPELKGTGVSGESGAEQSSVSCWSTCVAQRRVKVWAEDRDREWRGLVCEKFCWEGVGWS